MVIQEEDKILSILNCIENDFVLFDGTFFLKTTEQDKAMEIYSKYC